MEITVERAKGSCWPEIHRKVTSSTKDPQKLKILICYGPGSNVLLSPPPNFMRNRSEFLDSRCMLSQHCGVFRANIKRYWCSGGVEVTRQGTQEMPWRPRRVCRGKHWSRMALGVACSGWTKEMICDRRQRCCEGLAQRKDASGAQIQWWQGAEERSGCGGLLVLHSHGGGQSYA